MKPNLPNRSFNTPTSAATRRKGALRIAAALAACSLGIATAGTATADPNVMPVGGMWTIIQDGNGYTITVNLQLDGGNITGTASTQGLYAANVTGTVDDNHIHLVMPWNANSVGIYDGYKTPNKYSLPGSYLDGHTCDQKTPTACSHWYSENLVL
jgi:hypothetical protein